MIQAQNISFKYPKSDRWILKNFSAKFPKSEIVALTGPNGCGKTTLSKLLTGILKPQRGNIYIDDVDISHIPLSEIGKKIGLVMQSPDRQIFCTSVREEIQYGLKNLGLEQAEIEKRTAYYLNYFQLYHYRNTFPFEMSMGEKQRLILAAVLAMRPHYLLLDEPTASLDIYRKRLLGELIKKIHKETKTGIIVISHDRDFIEEYTTQELKMEVAAP